MIASMASVAFINNSSGNEPDPPPIIDITNTPQATSQAKVFPSPARVVDGTKPYRATFKTSKGDIVIDLATDTKEAVNSLAFLAGKNFYDGQAFFYIDHRYWAQAGDPACNPELDQTCTGTGDAGYKLPVEGGTLKHVKWSVVAPAVQGGDSLVSAGQFRVLFADDPRLDGGETVFGTVVQGQDILESAPDFFLCSAVTQQIDNCSQDLSQALLIEDVVVEPRS
jgi:cyclophilin family peptidyl-prolyl cis-trans isomerase